MGNLLGSIGMILVLAGCASGRVPGWEDPVPRIDLSQSEQVSLAADGKKHWGKRHERTELSKAIAAWSKLAQSNPNDYETLVFLTRAHYLMGDGHAVDPKEKLAEWSRGAAWGERALATHPEFMRKVLSEGGDPAQALEHLGVSQIDALYWTASNLGKWARASGVSTTLKYRNRIRKMIERVEQLNSRYFYSAPARFWGAYYATAPSIADGDLSKSRDFFEKSIKDFDGYLGTHVLFAEIYATRIGDRELFKRELQYVLAQRDDIIPEITQENLMEKRKARRLLDSLELLF